MLVAWPTTQEQIRFVCPGEQDRGIAIGQAHTLGTQPLCDRMSDIGIDPMTVRHEKIPRRSRRSAKRDRAVRR